MPGRSPLKKSSSTRKQQSKNAFPAIEEQLNSAAFTAITQSKQQMKSDSSEPNYSGKL